MVREAAVNQRPVRKLMKRGLESGEMRDPVPQTVGAEHRARSVLTVRWPGS